MLRKALIAAGLLASSVAIADGGYINAQQLQKIDDTAQTDANPFSHETYYGPVYAKQHFYVELGGGYDFTNIADNQSLTTLAGSQFKNNTPIAMGAAGFQFDRYVAIEAGAFYALPFKAQTGKNQITQWNAYGALKFIAPFTRGFSAFAKVGAQYVNYKSDFVAGSKNTFKLDEVKPFLAIGASYDFYRYFYASVQGAYIPMLDYKGNGTSYSSDQYLATASLGVAF